MGLALGHPTPLREHSGKEEEASVVSCNTGSLQVAEGDCLDLEIE